MPPKTHPDPTSPADSGAARGPLRSSWQITTAWGRLRGGALKCLSTYKLHMCSSMCKLNYQKNLDKNLAELAD